MEKHYLTTASGEQLFFRAPDPKLIRVADIARGGSRDCRYAGQLKRPEFFYSVAQHAVLVSLFCDPQDARHALFHDGSEAFMRDIPNGLKKLPEMEGYRILEERIQSAIYTAFGLATELPSSVKTADKRVAATEALQLLRHVPEWVGHDGYDPIEGLIITPLQPLQAEVLFLNRFEELFLHADRKAA